MAVLNLIAALLSSAEAIAVAAKPDDEIRRNRLILRWQKKAKKLRTKDPSRARAFLEAAERLKALGT
jgi:hypothetical protein